MLRDRQAIIAAWATAGHEPPTIKVLHGGSGALAHAVIGGLDAQLATLAFAADKITAQGNIDKDWQARLPHNSRPYISAIVFPARHGNLKDIQDLDDLI